MQCEHVMDCPLFNDLLRETPALVEKLKQQYCLGGKEGCARYLIASELGIEHMPLTLMPCERTEAEALLGPN